MLVLDRRHVRHLRREGRLLTLHVRFRGPKGVEAGIVEGDRVRGEHGTRAPILDPDTLALEEPYELLTPLEAPEIWCAGVTYERSRDARIEESGSDVYALVYDAQRPELFLKDAAGRRTAAPGAPVGIREDSTWNVPEPEIGLVLGRGGEIDGYTIGNDVSSRDIEGANPLYLPQAKVYAGAVSIGPAILPVADHDGGPFELELRIVGPEGKVRWWGSTTTDRMRRSFQELVDWLLRDNPVPPGSVLLTGTGLVPPDSFTLQPGQRVEIHVPGIGTLANDVVLSRELLERSAAHV